MAMATIGALRVTLGADTAQFTKGLSRAGQRLNKFGRSMVRIGTVAAGAIATAGVGVGLAVRGMLKEADKLTKMAQQIGVPVEELSRLKHAADLSGVSIESLGNGVGRMSRNMQDAADGLKTPQRAFAQLGIEIKRSDGSLKSMSEIMPEVADRFSSMEDGTQKTALSMILFGRAGRELIPLLNQGAEGMKNMMQEADRLGIVIDEKTGKAAEAFNDNMNRLSKLWDGIITQVTAKLAPGLARLSDILFQNASDGDLFKRVASGLAEFMKGAIGVVARLALTFQRLGAEIAAVGQAIKLFTKGEFSAGLKVISDAGAETERAFASLKATLADIFNATEVPLQQTGDSIKRNLVKPLADAAAAEKEHKKAMAEGVRVFEATRTPAEALRLEHERLNALLQAGAINQDTFSRATQLSAEQAGATWQQAGQSIAGSFAHIASSFGQENKSMARVAKAAGIAQATISMFTGAAKALELPFPANLAAMATVLAQGAALVASVQGVNVGGFAHGGSFMVGGSAGMDSNLVAMELTRGERVNVETPGQQGRGAQAPQRVTINLPRERNIFGRRDLENMVKGLNEVAKDGWVIEVRQA